MKNMKIEDESGDRKYFTIIPNHILNHSTANDQALYLQMKRCSGEQGECYLSERTLMEKLGIGNKALKSSLNYLLSHEWIKTNGYKSIQTDGGIQKVKSYKIKDIWKLNVESYKGAVERQPLKSKVLSKGVQRGTLSADKEEPNTNKNLNTSKVVTLQGNQTSILLKEFEVINPVGNLYSNTTERKALEDMASQIGYDKLMATIKALPEIISKPFAPKITKPTELKRDFGKLLLFVKQEKNKVSKYQAKSINI